MSEITTVEAPKKRGRKANPAIALLRAQLAEAVAKRKAAREERKLNPPPKAPRMPKAKKILTAEEIEAKRALKADAKKARQGAKQETRIRMLEERQVFIDAVSNAQAALKAFDASHKKTRKPKVSVIEVVS